MEVNRVITWNLKDGCGTSKLIEARSGQNRIIGMLGLGCYGSFLVFNELNMAKIYFIDRTFEEEKYADATIVSPSIEKPPSAF